MPILGTNRKSPADALFTRTQQRVLGVLFGQPDRGFWTSEIIRLAHTGSGSTQRELARLKASGLIWSLRAGNQIIYRANPASPIFEELTGIIAKTVGLAEPLRTALAPLSPQIQAAFVFGSVAKRTDSASSDVDLMILADDLTYAEIFSALDQAGTELGRTVNPTVYTRKEFAQRRRDGVAFLARVLELPKIWIIGSESDLA